ncbi:hypothetical protein WA026_012111 [Henosepilachna vigintioctopunctata]|uniref:Aminopeptidase N n=1 Tax=Henosepilachna vigintioctopunctata TaxID=420089 RepID=A0AAW1VCL4_9CUCU
MGLVKAMYQYKNGTEVLVVTDFQPTYARRAFPCFDEPALKASFNFTIITPDSSWKALANSDEIDHEETPEGVIYRFKSTPPMSTDVISFAITKMDFIENNYIHKNRNLRIRTFLGDAKEENQTFVLNFADKSVQYFEEFTGVDYPMSKIDFLEYDKKFTATEYWGLTTFNRGFLHPSLDLYDSRQISIVVAHELTHYWFGNLVTNKWWSDIWLQEGFAQYLSHKVVDSVFNTTNVEEYPLDYTYEVFKEDMESKSVNPIVANCSTPKEIMLLFNDITYIKAGSLIRLLDFITGVDGFKKIIQKYFEEFSFRSANTEDFVSTVEKTIPNQHLRDFLESWLLQNRYPIVKIEEDLKNKQYVLRQRSASLFRDTDKMSPFGYKWTIPIIYTTDLKKEPTTVWFRKEMDFLTIPKGEESYIKLNYNFMGIYFTNYTQKMWLNLIENIHMLNEIEQAQLILEADKLFEAEIINCDVSLRLISRVSSEPNQYSVSPLSVLFSLRDRLKFDQTAITLLRQFYRRVRMKSKLVRRKEEDTKNFLKKVRRSIHTESPKDDIKL